MNPGMAPKARSKGGGRITTREARAVDASRRERRSPGVLRVLCVDDNATCLRLVSEVLARSGCEVECAADARDAAARAVRNRFDVLVTDHDMPGMNGLALVEKLRRSAFTGKIVVVSAGVGSAEDQAYRAHGVAGILHKPFTAPALLRVVHGA